MLFAFSRAKLLLIAIALMASACASPPVDLIRDNQPALTESPVVAVCRQFLYAAQEIIVDVGASDAESSPIAGYPYLRVNRFLADFPARHNLSANAAAFDAWISELRELDRTATRIELRNLPANAASRVATAYAELETAAASPTEAMETCSDSVMAHDTASPAHRAAILAAATVPDNYSTLARVGGVYPITAVPVQAGWNAWKAENLSSFRSDPFDGSETGDVITFVPDPDQARLTPDEVSALLDAHRHPTLGTLDLSPADFNALAATFAPRWRVQIGGSFDFIGHPQWSVGHDAAIVDLSQPAVFVRLSYTWYAGEVLPQLSYLAWFSERPSNSALDLLAGHLDGVIWRVTLGRNGEPLVYDTIHACGCYHLFFPTQSLQVREDEPEERNWSEEVTVARTIVERPWSVPVTLHLASGSHYLRQISFSDEPEKGERTSAYLIHNDVVLRSLPLNGGGYRSLYGADGLVSGTERLERFILWPMGIKSPGAMRQWGHHATAFVGRRHFDDPDLLEKSFVP